MHFGDPGFGLALLGLLFGIMAFLPAIIGLFMLWNRFR